MAGKPYGALYALYSGRKLSHVELELLELLAGHAGVALTNAMAFEEVVRQRAHERAVIDGSADGIAVLDAAGLVRQWNPAAHRITGIAAPDVIGKPPSFPLPEPGATVTDKLANGRWLDVLCTALADGGELVIDFRDVTAAKELEEAKDLFLATTSHELRTPITVVQGFASTLASRWDQLGGRRTAGRGADHRRAGRLARQAGGTAAAGIAAGPTSCRSATARSTSPRCCAAPPPPSGRCQISTRRGRKSPMTCRPPAATPWLPTSSSASSSRTPSSTRPTAGRSPSGPR